MIFLILPCQSVTITYRTDADAQSNQ